MTNDEASNRVSVQFSKNIYRFSVLVANAHKKGVCIGMDSIAIAQIGFKILFWTRFICLLKFK